MINHARTLLLNMRAEFFNRDPSKKWAEVVPTEFIPVSVPVTVGDIRKILFGRTPDPMMMNYRARQILQILHRPALEPYVTGLDTRITYDPKSWRTYPALRSPQVKAISGEPPWNIVINNVPNSADETGRMKHEFIVTVLPNNNVRLSFITNGFHETYSFEPANGVGSITMAFGLKGQLTFPNVPGAAWNILAYDIPKKSVIDLLKDIQSLSPDILAYLFGTGTALGSTEPFRTFYKMFTSHPDATFAFAAAVLALIYRMNIEYLETTPED